MKERLIGLGLSEDCIEDLLEAFEDHQQIVHRYNRPAGKKSLERSLDDVGALAKKLADKISSLSTMERQQLDFRMGTPTRNILVALSQLCGACVGVENLNIRFDRKKPYRLEFAKNVRSILEKHGHSVKVYRDNIFVPVMSLFIDQPTENEAFELLRKVIKPAA